jgi:hypothetical protein
MAAKMTKKKKVPALNNTQINENSLFTRVSKIIEKRKNRAECTPTVRLRSCIEK